MFVFASYICFLAFAIGLAFCLYLVSRFKQFTSTWLLLALIISLSFNEFYMYALSSKTILQMPFLFRSVFPLRILFGPLLFCYVQVMLYPDKPFKLGTLFHFMPMLICIVCLWPDFAASNLYKIEILKGFYTQNTIFIDKPTGILPPGVLQPIILAHGSIYCLATLAGIYQYKKRQNFKTISVNKMVLKWLLLVSVVVTFFIFFQWIQYFSLSIGHQISAITQIFQSASLVFMKGYLLLSPGIIENMDGCVASTTDDKKHQKPLIPVALANSQQKEFDLIIQKYFKENKAYLNSDFGLKLMAADLNLTPKKLSTVLNNLYEIHFAELVNRYRLKHLMHLMESEEGKILKLEALILGCGFQYRSSFYAAFKKIMGTTPSAYFKETKTKENMALLL